MDNGTQQALKKAIEKGDFDVVLDLLDRGASLISDEYGSEDEDSFDTDLIDPLAVCCNEIAYMAGDFQTRQSLQPYFRIAHLLVDRGASLLREDTARGVTPLEYLTVIETMGNDEALDVPTMLDIARLAGRCNENPVDDDYTDGLGLIDQIKHCVPGRARIPSQLMDILRAMEAQIHMDDTVPEIGQIRSLSAPRRI